MSHIGHGITTRAFVVAVMLTAGCAADASSTDDAGSTGMGSASGSSGVDGSTTNADSCEPVMQAIVTDIDETLTLSDSEWLMQIADGTYEPRSRDGSAELVRGYAERGFRILYLTARPETIVLEGTGEGATDATRRWLVDNGFPVAERTEIQLAPNFVINDTARAYKADALQERQDRGWVFDYAYGNALSDIGAYADAGIGKDVTFIIGEEAGAEETTAIAGEGWVEHNEAHLASIDPLCTPVDPQ